MNIIDGLLGEHGVPYAEIDYLALTREHFSAEEELCFPLAEDALPQDQLLRLGDTWAARRGLAGV